MSILDPVKRVARLRKAAPRRTDEFGDRLPPGQYRTQKFPVLTYGETPRIDLQKWRLRLFGLVEHPLELNWQQFKELPTTTIECDIHCVTRWSKLDTVWRGVPFQEILKMLQPRPEATHVMQHAYGGYTTNLALEELNRDGVLLAFEFNGEPLEREHGGPLRLVVPHLYFWKSAKWLNGLEFMSSDRAGFWERYGYHMHGDPWAEERFG